MTSRGLAASVTSPGSMGGRVCLASILGLGSGTETIIFINDDYANTFDAYSR